MGNETSGYTNILESSKKLSSNIKNENSVENENNIENENSIETKNNQTLLQLDCLIPNDILLIICKIDITICLSIIITCKFWYNNILIYNCLFEILHEMASKSNDFEILNKISTSIIHNSIKFKYNELFYIYCKHMTYTILQFCEDNNYEITQSEDLVTITSVSDYKVYGDLNLFADITNYKNNIIRLNDEYNINNDNPIINRLIRVSQYLYNIKYNEYDNIDYVCDSVLILEKGLSNLRKNFIQCVFSFRYDYNINESDLMCLMICSK